MKPTRPEQVRHIAKLARLDVQDDELDALTRDLTSILEFVGQITDHGSPESAAAPAAPAGVSRRADQPHEREPTALLEAAPLREGDLFSTPGALG